MSDIVVHTFRDQQVRTTMGPDGEPRFVLSDLCKALNLTNAAVVARRLSDSMKGVSQIYTPGGPQVQPIHLPGGRLIESVTTLITGKGQEDLINGFLNGSYTI